MSELVCPSCGRGILKDHCWPCLAGENERLHRERDDARELAAMYLQCLNSRALERGESVERVAKFNVSEFAENAWLKDEYKRLADDEAATKAFIESAGLRLR